MSNADVTTTVKAKDDQRRTGLTVGDLKEFLSITEGVDDDTPVKVTCGWKGQLLSITV
ncbi:hypothetical protein [Streptomyces sp. NPDC002547]